LEEWPSG